MRLYLSSFRNGNQPDELIKLLAGRTRTALIANAIDFNTPEERQHKVNDEIARLSLLGLKAEDVDLRNYFGKDKELATKLAGFDLVWVRGGNTFILRRACAQSGADTIIKELLEKDQIVYGGYSAGIDLISADLHGIELVDDPHVIPDNYESDIIWEGLGILPYTVNAHYKSDHPESADIDKAIEYMIEHHVPFMALRDGEAIVIDGKNQMIAG
jgi:dipeptidase E